MVLLHIILVTTLALVTLSEDMKFSIKHQSGLITGQNNNTIEIGSSKHELEFLKKLFYERRKKQLSAVKHIKNVQSYEQRYKMIYVIIGEMVNIIESKKLLFEHLNDTLTENTNISLSNDIKDALLSLCESTTMFGDIFIQNSDITHRILRKDTSWFETLKWSLMFINENSLLLDESAIAMLKLSFQQLNSSEQTPQYLNPNETKNLKKSSQNTVNKHEASKKFKKFKRKPKGPQIVHTDL